MIMPLIASVSVAPSAHIGGHSPLKLTPKEPPRNVLAIEGLSLPIKPAVPLIVNPDGSAVAPDSKHQTIADSTLTAENVPATAKNPKSRANSRDGRKLNLNLTIVVPKGEKLQTELQTDVANENAPSAQVGGQSPLKPIPEEPTRNDPAIDTLGLPIKPNPGSTLSAQNVPATAKNPESRTNSRGGQTLSPKWTILVPIAEELPTEPQTEIANANAVRLCSRKLFV